MRILVSGATRALVVHRVQRPYLGVLVVPFAQNRPERVLWPGCVWAGDNGAFTRFHPERFEGMLHDFRRHQQGCRFVAVPDVVGDADRTLALFRQWAPVVRAYGYPVALVAQDGLTVRAVPWHALDAIFIGGTTDFKLGHAARNIAAYARALGKWVHMGRVNSVRRMRYAKEIGVQSIDGKSFTQFTDAIFGRIDRSGFYAPLS